ncbi:MAG: hypothetical protein ACI4ES_07895 [Roseburia sp.]
MLRTNLADMFEAWTNNSNQKNVKSNFEKLHFCLGEINCRKNNKKDDIVAK